MEVIRLKKITRNFCVNFSFVQMNNRQMMIISLFVVLGQAKRNKQIRLTRNSNDDDEIIKIS